MDHPAEACVVDLDLMKNNAPEMHRAVMGVPLADPVLEANGWSAERVRYFGSRSNTVDEGTIEAILLGVEKDGSPIRWAAGGSTPGKGTASDAAKAVSARERASDLVGERPNTHRARSRRPRHQIKPYLSDRSWLTILASSIFSLPGTTKIRPLQTHPIR